VLAPELTPYRLHFHRRIVREIPELRLWSLVTLDSARSSWRYQGGADIGAVRFGEGELARRRGPLSIARLEWEKARAVTRWLQEHQPAAVFAAGYNRLPQLAAIRWGYRHGVPVLMWADSNIHGDTARGLRRIAKNALLRRVLPRVSAVLACGSLGRQYFLRYGVPPGKIFLCPYEPDYEEIEHSPPERTRAVMARLGLDPQRRRVLVCGRLVPVKRPDLAVDAFAAIADQRPGWDLVLAGDGPLAQATRDRVPARLRQRVVFTGFIGDQGELTALYRACEVLLHPADYEPWALVINEAAASGLAIVASAVVGAAAELVRDGENGRLCPPGDLSAFARALLEATGPPPPLRMGAASRERVRVWRAQADPVQGLRHALKLVGTLSL
jgi:glycosyltransferase involved in cell wall biosynthesis